jgi:undecaprenyl phosphate-alpha-L-ara4FN deformylase
MSEGEAGNVHPERRVALKIDVDTLAGTLEGVPRLADLLTRLELGATFYFSVGPDHTGRALRRVFRRGFLHKVRRTSVVSHYGVRTLLYGTVLPGPNIGRRAGSVMRAVRDAGFEVGVHCYDHVRWQDQVTDADATWTSAEFGRALAGFTDVFGVPPESHAAAGWQINAQVLALESAAGLRYASDVRGSRPFYPVCGDVLGRCVQIPTTLPTFDELVGVGGRDASAAAQEVLRITHVAPSPVHVFTLHAELEGRQLLPQLEWLLRAWLNDGCVPGSLRDLAAHLPASLPRHAIELGTVPGRSGLLALQGRCLPESADGPTSAA